MIVSSLSLRAQIAAWAATITALALVLLAAGTWTYVYFEDLEAIDEHLLGEAHELLAELALNQVDPDEFAHDVFEHRQGMAAFNADGTIFGITPTLPEDVARLGLAHSGFAFQSREDSRWRILSVSGPETSVVISHNLDEFDDVLTDLATIQFLLVPLVALLTAWISWLVSGRALLPVRRATEAAASIGSGNLSQRLPVIRPDDEIGQFTTVLNSMLDRIEKNYQQAKRFAGDASHELRTPLTIIKGELENLIAHTELSPVAEQRIISAQQEADRMHQIIDQLLLLARFDAGKASGEHAPVDLSELLQDLAEDVDLLCAKPEIIITGEIAPSVRVKGDSNQLRRLFLNLFTNAVKYNHRGGALDYRLRIEATALRFEISNTGPIIRPEDQEKIFERFFQTDHSHTVRGSGLGLSLCREIVQAHGGTIHLESSNIEHTQFIVTLPVLLTN
jgi:two-component system heavy metal sensor histidine kinase CusS